MQPHSYYGKLFCTLKSSLCYKSDECLTQLGDGVRFNNIKEQRSQANIYHSDSVTRAIFING